MLKRTASWVTNVAINCPIVCHPKSSNLNITLLHHIRPYYDVISNCGIMWIVLAIMLMTLVLQLDVFLYSDVKK